MKRSWFGWIIFMVVWTTVSIHGVAQDGGKTKKKKKNTTTPNSNYKHSIPTSEGHTFKENFTAASKDSVNRNYKQQNRKKGNVRFKDHFSDPGKQDHHSYKDPEGL